MAPLFVSYPKSGRTWIRHFLDLRNVAMEFTHAGTGANKKDIGRVIEEVDTALSARPSIVFMHRNPIDTAISFYFQIHRKELRPGSFRYAKRYLPYVIQHRLPPRRIEDFLFHPGYGIEKVCRFNAAWLAQLQAHPNCFVLSYETARTAERSTFSGLLRFLDAGREGLAETIEKSSFRQMQRKERSGALPVDWFGLAIPGDPDSAKVRRGKVRGYVDYLDAATISRCRRIANDYGFEA